MIKALLIVLSLAANVALAALLIRQPELAPPSIARFLRQHGAGTPAPSSAAVGEIRKAAPPKLWTLLDSGDLKTLMARLHAAGFPPEVVRGVIEMRLNRQFRERYHEMEEGPYWKPRRSWTREAQVEYAALTRERNQLRHQLLSDPWLQSDDVSAYDQARTGRLPREKIELLRQIEDDYTEMTQQITSAANNILLDEDRQKLALLQKEKLADLAAVLSPAELEDYQMRTSPVAVQLARRIGDFQPSDSEFFAIYQAYRSLSDRFGNASFSNMDMRALEGERAGLSDRIKAALGEQRAAEYIRKSDPAYAELVQLAATAELPAGTAGEIFDIRDALAASSQRIAEDPNLSVAEKRTALKQLADNSRLQIATKTGASAAQVLSIAEQWLRPVERGSSISFQPGLLIANQTGTSFMSNGPVIHSVARPAK
jgi:hypothetical protein